MGETVLEVMAVVVLVTAVMLVTAVPGAATECYLDVDPSVGEARDYIACLRQQLDEVEADITASEAAVFKRALLEDVTDTQSGDYQYTVSYSAMNQFPDCRGLRAEQCASLLTFLDSMTGSYQLDSDPDIPNPAIPDPDSRYRRSTDFNEINPAKLAQILANKQLNPESMKNIKMLIEWHKQYRGDGDGQAAKYKSRWGRSVDDVTVSPVSRRMRKLAGLMSSLKRRRPRYKRNIIREFMLQNVNGMSPKVRQMLAEYIAWRAQNPAYVKIAARHG